MALFYSTLFRASSFLVAVFKATTYRYEFREKSCQISAFFCVILSSTRSVSDCHGSPFLQNSKTCFDVQMETKWLPRLISSDRVLKTIKYT